MKPTRWSILLANALLLNCSVGLSGALASTPAHTIKPARAATVKKAQAAVIDTDPADKRKDAKDLFLKQSVGLQYSIELIRDGRTSQVDSRFPFKSGDQLRFRVRPNTDGYMYIVMKAGSTGSHAVLFPDAATASDANNVQKNNEYLLPQGGVLQFDENPGLETLQLVLARTPVNDSTLSKFTRSITISPKAGGTKIGTDCFLDTPASLSTGNNTDKSQQVTMVTTDMTTPLAVDLLLQHHSATSQPPLTTAQYSVQPGPSAATTTTVASTPRAEHPAITPANPTPQQIVRQAGDSRIPDKWAFVVGISKFQRPGMNLLFAAKDAQDFSNFLVNEQHFARDHVKVLTNEEATKKQIMAGLCDQWAPKNIKPGDLLVIYMASHASADRDDVLKQDTCLITYDTDPLALYSTGIPLKSFSEQIKERLAKVTDRIVVILDTCHAGSAKSVALTPKSNAPELFQGTGKIVVAACEPDQVSFDSTEFKNGLFTRCLIDGLRRDSQLQTAFDTIKTSVEKASDQQFHRKQSPVLKLNDWKGSPLVLSVPPCQPRPAQP